jgi:predicted transglutaminase-like cysteine proteinase
MLDTTTIDFMEAMENWAEAREEYHDAKRSYVGYSPDYALYHEREKLRKASHTLTKLFIAAVREAVKSDSNKEE